jgi:hypothetical protein
MPCAKLWKFTVENEFTTTYAIQPITTDVVSSNLDKGELYNIMW